VKNTCKAKGALPPDQAAIRAKCFHPTGRYSEFQYDEVEQSITDRFEKIARMVSTRIAVKTQNEILSYQDLNASANRIARSLLSRRGNTEEPVALMAGHDGLTISAMLGILKAGKICVPIDPSLPRDRLTFTLKDSRTRAILVSTKDRSVLRKIVDDSASIIVYDEVDSRLPVSNPGIERNGYNLAFILYTSGSTGQPKGVMQSHRVKLHRVLRNTNAWHICPDDRVNLFSYLTTGWGLQTSLDILLNGAMLVCINIKQYGVATLKDWLRRERITLYASTPTLFRSLANTFSVSEQFPDVRAIRLAGERVCRQDLDIYKKYFPADCVLGVSLAGTEAGTFCQYFMNKDSKIVGETVPVGYPEEGMEILLLNDRGERVGLGASGEIAIRSSYCSLGYWRRPEETGNKFLEGAADGDKRIYLSGDLGRLGSDGCLEYLGRKDFQVKIRGYRVELEEIEQKLRSCGGVRQAAVVYKQSEGKEGRLVAYVTGDGKTGLSIRCLRQALAAKLPDFMMPSVFVILKTFSGDAYGQGRSPGTA